MRDLAGGGEAAMIAKAAHAIDGTPRGETVGPGSVAVAEIDRMTQPDASVHPS
jgi:hypothetical protein